MPRALLLAAAVVAAVPASAQSRYLAACVDSSDDEPAVSREQAEALCACSAERALLPERGLVPADLDRFGDFAAASGPDLELEGAPEAIQETAIVAVGSLMECLVAQGLQGLIEGAVAEAAPVQTASGTKKAASGPAPAAGSAPLRPRATPGLRTGNGTAALGTLQTGAGAAIRVVR